MDTKQEFADLLEAAVEETGVALGASRAELAAYMAERAAHLSLIVHEPGFDQALMAERNNVALRAGLEMSDQARAVDQKIVGIIGGALRIAAAALV